MKMPEIKKSIKQYDNITEKRNFLSLAFCVGYTILCLILVGLIIVKTYKPDIQSIISEAEHIVSPVRWPDFVSNIMPHPTENLIYLFCLLLLPIFLASFYFVFNAIFKEFDRKIVNVIYAFIYVVLFVSISVLLYYASRAENFFIAGYIFDKKYLWLYSLIIFPVYLLILFLSKRFLSFSRTINIIFFIITGIFLSAIFFMNIFNTNAYWGAAYHLNAVFYSLSQVAAGKTLLVDIFNQYGLYPHFLSPIFSITGLSILKFSIVLSFINLVSFILIYIVLYKSVQNKFILFLGFTTLILINYLIGHGLYYYDVYFQYFPIRVIFPALLLFISVFYLKSNSKKIYYLSFPLFLTGILWNTETGIVVLISWMLLLFFLELAKPNSLKIKSINILRHALLLFVFLLIITLLLFLWLYAKSGHFPDFSMVFNYQNLFYFLGYNANKATLIHEWNIVILIYIYGLAVSIKSLFDKKQDSYYSIVFLLSILGLGLFSYYQALFHKTILCFASYPAILLLVIFTDRIYNNIVLKKTNYYNIATFLVLVFFLGTGIFSMVNYEKIFMGWTVAGFKSFNNQDPVSDISQNIALIKKHTNKGEKILIFSTRYDGLYFGETQTVSALNTPGYSEMFLKEDYDKIVNKIINNDSTKIFVDMICPEVYFYNTLLQNNYGFTDQSANGKMLFVEKNSGAVLPPIRPDSITCEICEQLNIIKYNPRPENYFNLGFAYGNIKLHTKEKESYLEAITLDPDYQSGYANLGWVCALLGEYEESIAYSKKALELNPDDQLAKYNLEWAENSIK